MIFPLRITLNDSPLADIQGRRWLPLPTCAALAAICWWRAWSVAREGLPLRGSLVPEQCQPSMLCWLQRPASQTSPQP